MTFDGTYAGEQGTFHVLFKKRRDGAEVIAKEGKRLKVKIEMELSTKYLVLPETEGKSTRIVNASTRYPRQWSHVACEFCFGRSSVEHNSRR